MSYIKAIDVSKWQGIIDWNAVKASGVDIAIIKMSGGDDGLYFDAKANQNYYAAKAAGLSVGMYHFAGGTDAVHEAEYFIKACSPLAENDVLVLDWEVSSTNPVSWCTTFVNRVHDLSGVWPLIYFNGSTWNSYDWTPVTQNCGVYVAWYGKDPENTLAVKGMYVMHQYTSTGSVAGINGNVDLDAWFGSVEQFNKYGYHAPQPPVITTPVEADPVEPTEPTETEPVDNTPPETIQPVDTLPVDTEEPKSTNTTPTDSEVPTKSVWQRILDFLKELFGRKV